MTNCKIGDRIRLVRMGVDPDPVAPGSTGTITSVTDGPLGQFWVAWDNGRTLALLPGVDEFELIDTVRDVPSGEGKVMVPNAVFRGIKAVRDSGMTNMLDRPMVSRLAREFGFGEAADWLSDPNNRKAYAEGIFRGFVSKAE